MKKTYIKPELEVVEVAINSLICTSITMSSENANNGDALAPFVEDNFDFGDDNDFVIEEENFSF